MENNSSSQWMKQCQSLIEQIVADTLQGKISYEGKIYKILTDNLNAGSGEIFERALEEEITQVQQRLETAADEMKQAKANRQQKALAMIKKVWQQWQKEKQETEAYRKVIQAIVNAPRGERLIILLQTLDHQNWTDAQIEQLAKLLTEQTTSSGENLELALELKQLSLGLLRGLHSLSALKEHITSWMYESSTGQLGFGSTNRQPGPWTVWGEKVKSPLAKQLFEILQNENKSVQEVTKLPTESKLSDLVELVILLGGLQQRLVKWFDLQPYSVKWGKYYSCSTLMTFAIIWGELSNGFDRAIELDIELRQQLVKGCFEVTLQILRTFAQRDDFPLYGGIFASFSGQRLQYTFEYLDRPLRELEGTREKGRILTILGYSGQILGRYDQAKELYAESLKIARATQDYACEIANLNHLSRISIAQKDYVAAIDFAQRSLILARQKGERLGECNALVNLGYSQVLDAHQREQMEKEIYQQSIESLKQALTLTERLDGVYGTEYMRLSAQTLACHSLGIAYLILEELELAIEYLQKGLEFSRLMGDQYFQGLNLVYLAEAYYKLPDLDLALFYGCLAMYLLEQISAPQWRQAAGLVLIVKGKIGDSAMPEKMQQYRSKIISVIGVDGFDYLPQLLQKY